jgi:transcriptional regulator with XRE-family HTH domain
VATNVYSPASLEAARLLGARVRLARQNRRLTVSQFAERIGVSRVTVQKIERGDPTVALGTAFEAAVLLGVTLFHPDPDRRRLEAARLDDMLSLLPASVRVTQRDDDF